MSLTKEQISQIAKDESDRILKEMARPDRMGDTMFGFINVPLNYTPNNPNFPEPIFQQTIQEETIEPTVTANFAEIGSRILDL